MGRIFQSLQFISVFLKCLKDCAASFCIGAAIEAARRRLDEAAVKRIGRWESNRFQTYMDYKKMRKRRKNKCGGVRLYTYAVLLVVLGVRFVFSVSATFVLFVFSFQMGCLYALSGFLVTHMFVRGPGEWTIDRMADNWVSLGGRLVFGG